MALKRGRDHAKVWKEFLKFFLIIISGLLYQILLVASEPVCYTLVSLDERNRYIKRVDCDGADKICHRFASSEDVNLADLLNLPCGYAEDDLFTGDGYPEDDLYTHDKPYKACNDWTSWNGSEYKYISTQQTWEESGELCESENSHLVTIETKEENDFVYKNGQHCYKLRAYFIGLNDRNTEGTWEWSDGTVTTYRNWGEEQPDGGDTNDCVFMYPRNGEWYDERCTNDRYTVCERNNILT